MKKFLISVVFISVSLSWSGCKEEKEKTGRLTLHFEELVDFKPLVTDTLKYINEAGNHYMITEVQYFISDPIIYYQNGEYFAVDQDNGIHYIDSDIPGTHTWEIKEEVPSGTIDSIAFTFGLDEATNQSGIFADPPESNMFWPDELGGGYHYMKLNGKWLDPANEVMPFNFHLGIGQTYDTAGHVTGYVQNFFRVNIYLPVYSSFVAFIEPDKINHLVLKMNIESWFKTPHTWDFNHWGGMMMQNQEALRTACENGYDAFAIGGYDK